MNMTGNVPEKLTEESGEFISSAQDMRRSNRKNKVIFCVILNCEIGILYLIKFIVIIVYCGYAAFFVTFAFAKKRFVSERTSLRSIISVNIVGNAMRA